MSGYVKGEIYSMHDVIVLGSHILFDIKVSDETVYKLKDLNKLSLILVEASWKAGANVLDSSYHHFGNGGVSGICLLEESHISVHTWPEYNSAAFDIFMCGECDPNKAVNHIIEYLTPYVWFNPHNITRLTF